jgi:NadR type nicotinamide-nucleotide adenylyltransferase
MNVVLTERSIMTENLSKKKLTGKRIGVVFGTFAPLHVGHQQEIYKALIQNDAAVVIVSGYTGDRGDKVGLSLEKRFRYLREAYNDEPDVYVQMLDETDIPRYPDGWGPWLDQLVNIVYSSMESPRDREYTIYTGEQDYVDELSKRLPRSRAADVPGAHWFAHKLDRDDIPISATIIRENPMDHWNDMNRVFRRHFTKKVLVMGSASTGKSTLVRRLARSINAPFSEEYARTYEEERNIDDNELRASDYMEFILGQDRANCLEVMSPANQGIVFFDTDAIVTKTYAERYLSPEDNRQLEAAFDTYIKRESPDLILLIPPITEYVDDGFRAMDWADDRYDFHKSLVKNIKEAGLWDTVEVLDDQGTPDDQGGYYARYIHAMKAVEDRLGVQMDRLH